MTTACQKVETPLPLAEKMPSQSASIAEPEQVEERELETPKDPSPFEIIADWERASEQNRSWSDFVLHTLSSQYQDMLNVEFEDASQFCPTFLTLSSKDRAQVYLAILGAMSRFESNHRPQTFFRESFSDSQGRRVVSRGLLQISLESGRGYGCPLRNEEDLHDPLINLDCGLRILNRWVTRDETLSRRDAKGWRGAARYWSVFRRPLILTQIQEMVRQISLCQENG